MAKLEQVVKSEIIRLAKKQIKAVCVPLGREVRLLKMRVLELTKVVAPLYRLRVELEAKRRAEAATLEAPQEQVETARLSPSLIQKLRKRLGINQAQLARLVGVSGSAVLF